MASRKKTSRGNGAQHRRKAARAEDPASASTEPSPRTPETPEANAAAGLTPVHETGASTSTTASASGLPGPSGSELRGDELESTVPSPADLAAAVNAIQVGDAEAVRDLEQRLRRSANADASESAWPAILEEPRRRADVRFADPATSHRPLVGPALVAAKRTFRTVFQPFINETLRRQVEFNESLLSSLAVIYEQVRVQAQTQALWRKEVEERLAAIERSIAGLKAKR